MTNKKYTEEDYKNEKEKYIQVVFYDVITGYKALFEMKRLYQKWKDRGWQIEREMGDSPPWSFLVSKKYRNLTLSERIWFHIQNPPLLKFLLLYRPVIQWERCV